MRRHFLGRALLAACAVRTFPNGQAVGLESLVLQFDLDVGLKSVVVRVHFGHFVVVVDMACSLADVVIQIRLDRAAVVLHTEGLIAMKISRLESLANGGMVKFCAFLNPSGPLTPIWALEGRLPLAG